MAYRDADLNVDKAVFLPKMTHHDMDAPPWWQFHRKKMIYVDGFAEKGHRGLMQFMLIRSNGPEKFRAWEAEFRDVFAYISSLEPPKYPYAIDQPLAQRGRVAFNRVCAECHGTYTSAPPAPLSPRGRGVGGEGVSRDQSLNPHPSPLPKGEGTDYPERLIPIDEVGTDPVRLTALGPEHRTAYGKSWFADYGKLANLRDPGGYIAPPLDGVWASGPYFHNGSVPTLWHVLHPAERPVVWRRSPTVFDPQRVGPQIETYAERPAAVTAGWEKRLYFDTRAFGKSAAGHEFPTRLSEDEKRAVLEYLKTL